MRSNVAAAVVERLRSFDTEYFFLLTGGDQPLWIALHEAGIKMVLARSEFSAVYMADGYARASGKPGITYGQAGPGAANVAAALADSFWAQSPVVAITGANASGSMYKHEYQSLDQMPMFSTVTKWSGFAASPEQVPELLSIAVKQATSGSQGPAHLDIPKDFFAKEIEVKALKATRSGLGGSIDLEPEAVNEFLEAFLSAEKPVILAGEGVARAGAETALKNLAEHMNVPVATTMGGKTTFPGSHPLCLGVIGRYSGKIANDIVAESDCVLVIGSRLGGLATNGYTIPSPSARILQIDTESSTFDLTYQADLKLVSDAKLALEKLSSGIGTRSVRPDTARWVKSVQDKIQLWREEVISALNTAAVAPVMSPLEVIDSLAQYNHEITVVADTGYMAAWTGVLYPAVVPGSYFRAVGSLGWALPASLGVQLARPEKVVCVTGDGGAGYHLADIETAVRMKIPVIIVIMNNNGLMFEYHEQKYRHGGKFIPEANDLSDTDYGAVARSLGAAGVRVQTRSEFEKAFKSALESDKPMVIDAVVDREAFPPVTNFEQVMARKI